MNDAPFRQGRILVGPRLEVSGREDVYALGDCAEDRWWLFTCETGGTSSFLREGKVPSLSKSQDETLFIDTDPLGC